MLKIVIHNTLLSISNKAYIQDSMLTIHECVLSGPLNSDAKSRIELGMVKTLATATMIVEYSSDLQHEMISKHK